VETPEQAEQEITMRAPHFFFAAAIGLAALTTGSAVYANDVDTNDEMMRVATGHNRVGRNVPSAGYETDYAMPRAGFNARYDYPGPRQPCGRVGRNWC
jgi:hypothetical protein